MLGLIMAVGIVQQNLGVLYVTTTNTSKQRIQPNLGYVNLYIPNTVTLQQKDTPSSNDKREREYNW